MKLITGPVAFLFLQRRYQTLFGKMEPDIQYHVLPTCTS